MGFAKRKPLDEYVLDWLVRNAMGGFRPPGPGFASWVTSGSRNLTPTPGKRGATRETDHDDAARCEEYRCGTSSLPEISPNHARRERSQANCHIQEPHCPAARLLGGKSRGERSLDAIRERREETEDEESSGTLVLSNSDR
jgi:hypothetical protein